MRTRSTATPPRPSVEKLENRRLLAAAPFSIGGDPSVNPADFRITEFASGLNFPYGMQQLPDGSYLVGTSRPNAGPGGGYFNSTGQLVRLADADGDGIADGPGLVVADGLPGTLTDIRVAGDLVFASGQGNTITVLRRGATPEAAYSNLGRINFAFPADWEHQSYALAVRATPGGPAGRFELFFNIGSNQNAAATPERVSVPVSGLANGAVRGDSIYRLMVQDSGTGAPQFSDLTRIARGLRNAAGIAFHPTTGDLYFEDNGADMPSNRGEPINADELNRLANIDIGGAVEDFGFLHDYIQYRTGTRIGSGAVQPAAAFQPIPQPNGAKSEGAVQLAFAPAAFPSGLRNGVFVGFHGSFAVGGAANAENPVVYYDFGSSRYFHFISSAQPGVGHLDGLLTTGDSLFLADLDPTSAYTAGGTGKIDQIKAMSRSPATVVARRVFYNNSKFDGNNTAPDIADDDAIAPDKVAALSNQTLNASNVTSYVRGLNGVMLDIAGLPADAVLTPADFEFRSTQMSGASNWNVGPAPVSVHVRRGAGVGGSDRVTLVWRDYNPLDASPLPQAVANGMLEVTVLANQRTGLATPDAFIFGNLIGDAANGGPAAVNATDLVLTRNSIGPGAAALTSNTDFDRNGVVNAADLVVCRNNLGHSLAPSASPAASAMVAPRQAAIPMRAFPSAAGCLRRSENVVELVCP